MRSWAIFSFCTGVSLIACSGATNAFPTDDDLTQDHADAGGNEGTNGGKGAKAADAGPALVKADGGSQTSSSTDGGATTDANGATPNPQAVDASNGTKSIDSGAGGKPNATCPSSNVSLIAQSDNACAPQPNRFADGHCNSPNDCGAVCCSCPGGIGFAVQACAGNQCAKGEAACACAHDGDPELDVCQ